MLMLPIGPRHRDDGFQAPDAMGGSHQGPEDLDQLMVRVKFRRQKRAFKRQDGGVSAGDVADKPALAQFSGVMPAHDAPAKLFQQGHRKQVVERDRPVALHAGSDLPQCPRGQCLRV
ncbi:MAG: hypothetical protein PHS14_19865 [Elusimicrobia bacterium]|nr:hypothetical protein [Elusimicrobiota bacterium]